MTSRTLWRDAFSWGRPLANSNKSDYHRGSSVLKSYLSELPEGHPLFPVHFFMENEAERFTSQPKTLVQRWADVADVCPASYRRLACARSVVIGSCIPTPVPATAFRLPLLEISSSIIFPTHQRPSNLYHGLLGRSYSGKSDPGRASLASNCVGRRHVQKKHKLDENF